MMTEEMIDVLCALPAVFEYPEPRPITADEWEAASEGLASLRWTLSDEDA